MNHTRRGHVLMRWPVGMGYTNARAYSKVEYMGSGGNWVKTVGEARLFPPKTSAFSIRYFNAQHTYRLRKVVEQTEMILMEWDDDEPKEGKS